MPFLLLLLLIAAPLMAEDEFTYDDYESISYIPEPMIFDLVRPLGSKKGQWEVNALILQEEATKLSQSHQSPEIEYVLWDNFAAEFEIPSIGGEPNSYKGALQWTLGHTGHHDQAIHGLQLIHQHNIKSGTFDETTPLYIFGYRYSKDINYLFMLGDQYRSGHKFNDHLLVANATIFHVYSQVKEIEFGIEQNLLGFGKNFQYWRITPQIEVVLENHMRLQMGFGILYAYKAGWESTSSFRFIKEFY